MRTTLNIAKDVLLAAKEIARRDRSSAGAVISELARLGLAQAAEGRATRKPRAFFGFKPLPPRGVIVTSELVNRLRAAAGD